MLHQFLTFVAAAISVPATLWATTPPCTGYTGWSNQANPHTDIDGLTNINYPEGSSTTYWGAAVQGPIGTVLTIHGRYPLARFMSLEITNGDSLVDYVTDSNIAPNLGENNPFVSGTVNGTYTAYVVFGPKPSNPALNTIYTGSLTAVRLAYRVYYPTDPNDPAGSATNPVLPDLWLNGQLLSNCPVQPMVQPPTATVWGRLDLTDWHGTPPSSGQLLAVTDPPVWAIKDPRTAHFCPNGANYYMGATLSREFLVPHTVHNIFVVRFKAPTFPRNRSGEAVYIPHQVRFWSLCTDDTFTTGVNRCVPDDASSINPNGYVGFVVSDPSAKPSDTALTKYYSKWVPWGALDLSGDVVYDRAQTPWGVNSPVHYYNTLIYRQTLADPSFSQSMANISKLPAAQQKAAMAAYWPVSGYCTKADFESTGFNCLLH